MSANRVALSHRSGELEGDVTITTNIQYYLYREAVEFLCNEGHVYSTIDYDHYKSTDT